MFMVCAWRSCGDAARNDPVDEGDDRNDEDESDDDAGDDHMQRIELDRIAIEVARLADAEERPEDRAQRARQRSLATHGSADIGAGLWSRRVLAHERPIDAVPAIATGSAGTLPPTSKKV